MVETARSPHIRVYGGGAADARFLGDLSALIGDFEPISYSTSIQGGKGHHSHSVSASTRPEKILDVSDLYSLPRGRALVFPAGTPPVLIRSLPWHTGPYAGAVKQSLDKYSPKGLSLDADDEGDDGDR